jgi:RNA polymerase sigma-B factor
MGSYLKQTAGPDGIGDSAAIELLKQWEPLARKLARRFAGLSDYEDLEQVARLALWQAAKRFEPARDCQFYSFAVPTIMGCLQRYVRDRRLAARIPRRWWELRRRMKQVEEELTQGLGREPGVVELAARLGESEEDVTGAMAVQLLLYPQSLDQPHEDAEGETGRESADKIGAPDPMLESADLRIMLHQAMDQLPADQRSILKQRFLQGMSRREVARQVGVPQIKVTRLEQRALIWMRQELYDTFCPWA